MSRSGHSIVRAAVGSANLLQYVVHRSTRIVVWLWRYLLATAIVSLLFIALVPRSAVLPGDLWAAIAVDTAPYSFDYIGWEASAISTKLSQSLFVRQPETTEARSQFVRDYMADVAAAQAIDSRIDAVFSDITVDDPFAVTEEERARRYTLRQSLVDRQSVTEAILEGQVASVLLENGFGFAGQVLPPIAMHFTRLPYLVVISPRDQIDLIVSLAIQPVPIDRIVTLEQQIETRHDVSALIVPLAGLALYPAMIQETASIPSAVETFAHEWLHHYLLAFPLGYNYLSGGGGPTRRINETTADLFGKVIAQQVLARYYPEQTAPRVVPPQQFDVTTAPDATQPADIDPLAFDFNGELHETRQTLDVILAAGQVDVAEPYLKSRLRVFYLNGYGLRRMNQAFFAFYGGYQAGGFSGIAGADPVGPAVYKVYQRSATIHDFIVQMRGIVTLDDIAVNDTGDDAGGRNQAGN